MIVSFSVDLLSDGATPDKAPDIGPSRHGSSPSWNLGAQPFRAPGGSIDLALHQGLALSEAECH